MLRPSPSSRAVVALIGGLLVLRPQAAATAGSAQVIERGRDAAPGVAAEAAVAYVTLHGRRGNGSLAQASGIGPLAQGLKLHNCTAVFSGLQGSFLPLSYSFVDAAGGDCVSFVVPEPQERARSRRARPSPELLALRAFDRMVALAGLPELTLAPAKIGLTGMPTYVWLERQPRPVSARAAVPGLVVQARAAPQEYRWLFGDGGELLTDHPGTPYRPKRPGSIAHTYEVKGHYTVTVEVVYHATYRVNGGPWRPLGAFRTSDSRPLPVRELIPMLVDSARY